MDRVYIIGKDIIPQKFSVAAQEQLRLTFVAMPGTCADIKSVVEIEGEGSEVDIAGVYLCTGSDRVSIDLNIRHLSGGSTSRQLFKGIVADNARADFSGLIYVAKDAQKTAAFQANHSILLSPTALVSSQPMLEIYADDVQCSHGSTSGYLSEDERFYMRSRGIPEAEALYLQKLAFIAPIAERLPSEIAQKLYDSII